jgi:type I restriction enzyme S subunit
MAGEWRDVSLTELYEFSSGLSKPRSAFGSGYPFLGFKDVFYNSSVPAQLSERVNTTEQERARCSIKRGDVFVTRTSETMDELGMSCVALQDYPDATFNGFTKRLRPKGADAVTPEYARYFFRAPAFRSAVTAMSSLSTRASLNNEMLGRLTIVLPPPDEQRAIAHILGTLDDKIELNRRISETLEAMARAFFKSWFVDFDPVRAKAEGRVSGLPQPLADLFPARLVDSELGEIPDGWEAKTIGDLLELAYGKALKAEDRRDGEVPVYGSNGQVGWHDERLAHGPGVVVGRKGNPGTVTWAPTDFFAIDTAFYVVPRGPCHSLRLLFHALAAHDLASLGADSAVPGLNRNLAYMSPQVLPPPPLLQRFDAVGRALDERVHACTQESRTLAGVRDALLPKLISGELRVKDAGRFVDRIRA